MIEGGLILVFSAVPRRQDPGARATAPPILAFWPQTRGGKCSHDAGLAPYRVGLGRRVRQWCARGAGETQNKILLRRPGKQIFPRTPLFLIWILPASLCLPRCWCDGRCSSIFGISGRFWSKIHDANTSVVAAPLGRRTAAVPAVSSRDTRKHRGICIL